MAHRDARRRVREGLDALDVAVRHVAPGTTTHGRPPNRSAAGRAEAGRSRGRPSGGRRRTAVPPLRPRDDRRPSCSRRRSRARPARGRPRSGPARSSSRSSAGQRRRGKDDEVGVLDRRGRRLARLVDQLPARATRRAAPRGLQAAIVAVARVAAKRQAIEPPISPKPRSAIRSPAEYPGQSSSRFRAVLDSRLRMPSRAGPRGPRGREPGDTC